MQNRYLLFISELSGQAMPADCILSASDDLAALKAAISSVRAPRQGSRIAFRDAKRDALVAQIFDVAELRVIANFHAMIGTWRDVAKPAATAAA